MKTNPSLTTKQKEVFEFIKTRIRENIPPTIREIACHMGFSSTGTVRDYLKALADKGYLKRQSNLSRSIQLLKDKMKYIGKIATVRYQGFTKEGKLRFGVALVIDPFDR